MVTTANKVELSIDLVIFTQIVLFSKSVQIAILNFKEQFPQITQFQTSHFSEFGDTKFWTKPIPFIRSTIFPLASANGSY